MARPHGTPQTVGMPWGRPPQDPDPFDDGLGEADARSWEQELREQDSRALPGVDAAFAEVTARALERLSLRLDAITARRVPVRGVTPGPLAGIARLRFADGLVVLVRSSRQGDLSRVVRALSTRRSVLLAGHEAGPEGVQLTLHGVPGRRPVGLVLIGPDQPD